MMSTRDPDQDLPGRIVSGDLSALHELLTRHAKTSMALMWRCIDGYGTHEDLKELLTEVGARAYFRAHQFAPCSRHPTVSAWLHEIARQVADEFVRRHGGRR